MNATIDIEKQYDPFYAKRKKELNLTDEYMEIYASTNIPLSNSVSHSEKLLRRLYHSRWMTAGETLELKELIKLIMLKIPYATIDSFNRLGLFDTAKNAGAYMSKNILSAKNGNGFIRAFATHANRCRKVYTLTNAAKQEMLSTLPENVQKALSPSKSLSAASNVHDAFCCNLYYFLLTDFNFFDFDWYSVPYFNLRGTFSEAVKNMSATFQENTNALRPDAFVRTLTDESSYYFVEQDMNTERAGRLTEKLKNYTTLFTTMDIEEINSTAILFSVFADTKPQNQAQKPRSSAKNSEEELLPSKLRKQLKEFAFYICISEKGMEQSVTDMEKELIEKKDTNQNSHYASAVKNQINGMLEQISGFHRVYSSPEEDTIENLFTYIEKQAELKQNTIIEEDAVYTNQIVASRKETLRKVIAELPQFQKYLKKGVKFVVTDTFHPEELHNILLTDHNDDVMTNILIPRLEIILGIDDYSCYSSVMFMGDDVYLCNQCEFENHPLILVAVENISADLGAWYRLQHFISRAEVFPQKEKNMYIIVLASNMEDIRNFNENIYEYSTLAERYCDEDTPTKPKNNVQFLYSCYEKQEDMDKFFVLDKNGTVHYM